MGSYEPNKIEKKWQDFWGEEGFFKAEDFSKKPKKYILIEFPYPSGDGLHVGHARSYVALDVVSRKLRMEGYNVLYPIGWDAFGLPTENYAIKTGIHPEIATKKNIENFKRQLKSLGLSFDWSREINTTDPEYYKWTQWIFLKLFEKGLAYQAKIPINWCPSCKIGLANEEVINGKCERCGAQTEQREIKQWLLKITKYADRLIDDLEKVDYLEKIKAQQINWIGKSYGAEVEFQIPNSQFSIKVFTTRVDTIFGVTAVVLAPEHNLISKIKNQISNIEEVEEYIKRSRQKTEFERTQLAKEKTGVELKGVVAVNPVNNEKVSIWVGDYVVATYGGGAVMMVPAHDKRDFDFAKKYGLPIKEVIEGGDISKEAFVDYGKLINSGQFTGLSSEEAIKKITEWLEKNKCGRKTVQYKLRDWVFSRQHYWGEPIPIIHCQKCGAVPVPEKDLPVKLPYVEKYQPTGTGESPLAAISEWVNTKCPKCNGPAKRETDTMPNWAGSNWYYLAYLMKGISNFQFPISKYQEVFEYWMPVDWYNGGMEHTTLHLLYSRFIYKFLWDIGAVPKSIGPEPYKKRTSHGIVLAEDGRKMSKSFGNVIKPDDIVKKYGADTLRVYEMFMGPFGEAITWSEDGLKGCYRFLTRVWHLADKVEEEMAGKKAKNFGSRKLEVLINKLIKDVSEDIENIKFNTAIAAFMSFINEIEKFEPFVPRNVFERFLILISPFSPHIAEELWQKIGHKKSILFEEWPKADPRFLKDETFELVIQINGKVRDKIKVPIDISEDEAKALTLEREIVKKWRQGEEIKQIIFVKNKLINIVI